MDGLTCMLGGWLVIHRNSGVGYTTCLITQVQSCLKYRALSKSPCCLSPVFSMHPTCFLNVVFTFYPSSLCLKHSENKTVLVICVLTGQHNVAERMHRGSFRLSVPTDPPVLTSMCILVHEIYLIS